MTQLTKAEAKALLKQHGFKLADLAAYLDILPRSLSMRWRRGTLSIDDTLLVHGFIALHSTLYRQTIAHKNNPALIALLDELDKNSQNTQS